MTVNSISQISFRQASPFPMEKNQGYFMPMPQAVEVAPPQAEDQVQFQPVAQEVVEEPKEEKKKKTTFREKIANVAKFFTTASEMTKASFKALWYGTATAGGTLAAFWALGAVPKQIKNKAFKKAFTEPIKSISTKGKIVAGVAALAVATVHIIKGVLKSNERAANVEHKLDVEHVTAS